MWLLKVPHREWYQYVLGRELKWHTGDIIIIIIIVIVVIIVVIIVIIFIG